VIDHLLNFPDEDTAAAALPEYCEPVTGVYVWRGDCCIPGVRVYHVTGTETLTDPETGEEYERELQVTYSGWFVLIARPELDLLLHELDACCLVRDRATGALLFTAPEVEPPLDGATISPQFV
jgi:hypothetical protein